MAAAKDPLKYCLDDLTSGNGKCCSFADDEMLKEASRRRFDVVIAWAIDRRGRSLIDLLGTIQTLRLS